MSASFWLEGQLTNDNGNAAGFNFQRRSTVSLAGNWGEVRLGRDYTPSFWNYTIFDPFGTNGVGTNVMLTGAGVFTAGSAGGANLVRANNDIGYFLPANLGGFYGQVNYWFGEQVQNGAATEKDGNGYGLRLGYATGPFNVALSYSTTKDATIGDYSAWNLGGQWDFGVARVMAQYERDSLDNPTNLDARGYLIGANVPVGAGEIRAAWSQYKVDGVAADPKATKIALGYVHNLSKRTALYATIARVKNDNGMAITLGGAAAGAGNFSSTGYDLGIRHSF
jgi:predicted porin